mgnify:CR=1 FL=1
MVWSAGVVCVPRENARGQRRAVRLRWMVKHLANEHEPHRNRVKPSFSVFSRIQSCMSVAPMEAQCFAITGLRRRIELVVSAHDGAIVCDRDMLDTICSL